MNHVQDCFLSGSRKGSVKIKSQPMPASFDFAQDAGGYPALEFRAWMMGFDWESFWDHKCRAGFIPPLIPDLAG
jgi:hypothetical protein